MENYNGFHLNTNQPPFQVERENGEIHYNPYAHTSLLTQSIQTSPYYVQNPHYLQNAFAFEVPASDTIGVSAHSAPMLQTADFNEYKEQQYKIARANRKQKLADKKLNASPSSKKPIKKIYNGYNNGSPQNDCILYTRDNVKLTFLLKKTLTLSDVGGLGRILLPKREVEENLPGLATKEGVDIILREVFSNIEWRMRHRFWDNQKGYIYLFDQCTDFVMNNSLGAGDDLELYLDEQKNLYFTIQKKEKHAAESSDVQENVSENSEYYPSMTFDATEEENMSWGVLMEQLNDIEYKNGNTFTSW